MTGNETPPEGGNMSSGVVRVGDTVRPPVGLLPGVGVPFGGWLAGGLSRVIDRAFEAKLAVGSRSHR